MGRIRRFEDLEVWKEARELTKQVYEISNKNSFRDFSLRDQIRRAAISIMLNIAEGFARRTNNEFRQFLFIAHGSAAEVQSALYIAKDQKYIDNKEFETLYNQTDKISKMISSLIKYLGAKK